MPARALGPSMDASPSPYFGSLKGHRAFPRRNHVASETTPTRTLAQEHRVRHQSDQIAYSSNERINAWIPEASPIHVVPVIGKPLTPPVNFRDDFQSWIDDAALRARDFKKTQRSDIHVTKTLVQPSPPTPETTPPRKIHRTKAEPSLSFARNTSGESRTESFTTAKEDQSSEDEGNRSESPSLRAARQEWLRTTGISKHKDVGLGLGLESEDEQSTAKEMTPRPSPKPENFVTFDGAWGAEVDDALDRISQGHRSSARSSANLEPEPHSIMSRKRPNKRSRIVSQPPQDSPTLGVEVEVPPKRSRSLRERVEESRRSPPNASTERFAEQINWPLKEDVFDFDAEFQGVNDKRMSQASTTSTIIEAMVINSPPRRRQTLRHTSKMLDLNSLESPTRHSNRNSTIANDISTRRRLRKSKSPDQELRKSYASDSPETITVPSVTKLAPVPIHPDRLSSLQSSASGSKRLSRTFSLTSKQQSSRPTTAPEEAVGYFDIPQRRDPRTVSVVIHSATPFKPESKIENGLQRSLPLDASPPSASTSHELITTTSATSGGLMTHYSPQTPADQLQPTLNLHDAQDAQNLSQSGPSTGEWSAMLRPSSTLRTPFSLRSAHSSTPGTLEVNEATAISIYPHTNKSILVIQEMANSSDSSRPREHSAIIAGHANVALPGPVTPVIHHESPPRELLSPLKNPRDPPQPPDFRVIPPTPATASITRSPPKTPTRTNRFSAPITSIKRAFSARRPRSESIMTPFTRTFSLRGTVSTPRRRTQIFDDQDSKLHPFWQPRAFWDDMDGSDSESEFGNTGYLTTSRMPSHSSGTAGPLRRTMSLTRRFTGSLRFPHPARRAPRQSAASFDDQPHHEYEFARPKGYEGEESKRERVPSQGYQVQFVGFRGLADKLERRREVKEEGKREERRKWLRGRIGLVENGEDVKGDQMVYEG